MRHATRREGWHTNQRGLRDNMARLMWIVFLKGGAIALSALLLGCGGNVESRLRASNEDLMQERAATLEGQAVLEGRIAAAEAALSAAEKARTAAEEGRAAAAAARAAADSERNATHQRTVEAAAAAAAAEVERDTANLHAMEAAARAEAAVERARAAQAVADQAEAARETAETALTTADRLLMEANAALVLALRVLGTSVADTTLPVDRQISMNTAAARSYAIGVLDQSTPEGRALRQIHEIAARSNRISRADRLTFTSGGDLLRNPYQCARDVCVSGFPFLSVGGPGSWRAQVESIEILPDTSGVATLIERYPAQWGPGHAWVGWMDHSFFATELEPFDIEWHPTHGDVSADAFVYGDAPYTNPDVGASAVWRGAVVARHPATADDIESVVTGDAQVSVDLGGSMVLADVRLSDLENAVTGATYTDVVYNDLVVENGGFERKPGENDFLEGTFYGPNHEEVAGVFEDRQGLVGAYGARRLNE